MLLTTKEICQELKISRSLFDRIRPELYKFGLFQFGKKCTEYRMRQEDFEKYLNAKINKQ